MSHKATCTAPSNIAFVKYWGARDLDRVVPENPSISMTLRSCVTRTTVEHSDEGGDDIVLWRPESVDDDAPLVLEEPPPSFAERVHRHLDHLRRRFGIEGRLRVATANSFPAAAGIASSASGFAALTLAVSAAVGERLDVATASTLARESGSGSASRSVVGGYVQWPAAWPSDDAVPVADEEQGGSGGGFAVQLAGADHWDLRDVIAVVETGAKETSSLDGHRRARTSPYFAERLLRLPRRLNTVRKAIETRDFSTLGPEIESEAIDLHCMAMTSTPPIYYWRPGTLEVLAAVRSLRADGVPAFSTLDAGANVHVICEPHHEEAVVARLDAIDCVRRVLRDGVGPGPAASGEHLF
ncbi:MAG: diphosphomevalonate decarboxylase [Acidobacteriota bacterium]